MSKDGKDAELSKGEMEKAAYFAAVKDAMMSEESDDDISLLSLVSFVPQRSSSSTGSS